ncbi:MAG: methyltransferase [Proteobacteria bacterium]|nr:methyltransferase [Pseudomonadota bacterium]
MTLSLVPAEGESLDRLSLDRQVLQRSRGHRSGTDDLVAAYLIMRMFPTGGRVLDLGCGHGTVTLLLSALIPEAEFVCVEAQAVSADLALRNMALNGLTDRTTIIEGDLRDVDVGGGFDIVTGTPPFMPVGSGVESADPQRTAARFELRGGIEAYAEAAARAVTADGFVSLVMDASQDARCLAALASAGLPLWAVHVVTPRRGGREKYRAYMAGPGTPPGHAKMGGPLVLREEDGSLTQGWRTIRRHLRVES